MATDKKNTVVALYDNHEHAERAIKKLVDASIPLKKISVVGRGHHNEEEVVGFYNTDDRIKVWGKYGVFWGGLWGLLTGGLYLAVPITGPIVVLGDLAIIIMTAIEGAIFTGGLSVLAASLFSSGIPKDSILRYEQVVKNNGFLVMVQGTAEEAQHAREILNASNAIQVDTHDYQDEDIPESATLKLWKTGVL